MHFTVPTRITVPSLLGFLSIWDSHASGAVYKKLQHVELLCEKKKIAYSKHFGHPLYLRNQFLMLIDNNTRLAWMNKKYLFNFANITKCEEQPESVLILYFYANSGTAPARMTLV